MCPDKGETLLERCHGCVYPWAVCVDNNLLDKQTVTPLPPKKHTLTHTYTHSVEAIFISQSSTPACLATDISSHAEEPTPRTRLHRE